MRLLCSFAVTVILIATGCHCSTSSTYGSDEKTNATNKAPALKPVFLLHGINNKPATFDTIVRIIEQDHPGTVTIPLHSFDGIPESWLALNIQLKGLIKRISKQISADKDGLIFGNGYHLVCHSQGALLCRVMCQAMDDHRVDTLVSLAGPQLGVFGPHWLNFMPNFIKRLSIEEVYKLAYTAWVQRSVSAANIWNDPAHHTEYLQGNIFLPRYTGEQYEEQQQHQQSLIYKNQQGLKDQQQQKYDEEEQMHTPILVAAATVLNNLHPTQQREEPSAVLRRLLRGQLSQSTHQTKSTAERNAELYKPIDEKTRRQEANEEQQRMRTNFIRVKKAVFLVGNFSKSTPIDDPSDGGIEPWQSGIWMYYNTSASLDVSVPERLMVGLRDQLFYKNDVIGLRTLDERGALVLDAPPNVRHDDWLFDERVIRDLILPHLIDKVEA